MSILVEETAKSRKRRMGSDSTDVTLDYYALGSNDDTLVYAAVKLLTPKTYTVASPSGWPIVLRRNEIDLETVGAGFWLASVDYGFKLETADDTTDEPDTDDATPAGPELSFDTTGGTQHLTQSFNTVSSVAPSGATAPNYKNAIGVTRDSVAGVDVVAPKLEFTLTIQKVNLSRAYVRDLARNTGKVNSATWQGYAAGEVLFMGATGSAKPGSRFTITYKFAIQENRTNIPISGGSVSLTGTTTSGSTTVTMPNTSGIVVGNRVYGTGIPTGATVSSITPNVSIVISSNATASGTVTLSFGSATGIFLPTKKGWDYTWAAYKDSTDVNLLVQVPVAVYVEQVYLTFDFASVLGF